MKPQGYQLPLGTNVLRVKSCMLTTGNSEIEIIYQRGPYTIRKNCLMQLLEAILQPHAFDYLRTKEQLSYSVGVAADKYADILGFDIYVSSQEDKNSCDKVSAKIENFMNEVANKVIEELTDEDFENFKHARVSVLHSDDLDIDNEIYRNWNEIVNNDFMFNRVEVVSDVTKTLTKLELQEFFKSFTQPENMRRLNVQISGNYASPANDSEDKIFELIPTKLTEDEHLITNIEEFQKNLILYPVVDTSIEN